MRENTDVQLDRSLCSAHAHCVGFVMDRCVFYEFQKAKQPMRIQSLILFGGIKTVQNAITPFC